jgi:Zn-dependent M28 family amino/carboxypeptidase
MKALLSSLAAILCIPVASRPAPAQTSAITGERIRPHVQFLASDLLEGRGVGVRGGTLTEEYLAAAFAATGAKPAGDVVDGKRTYFQKVPLVGVTTVAAESEFAGLNYATDWVGSTQRQQSVEQIQAETVFAGHGISAPEFKWDDYARTDVRGKIVVLFTNEPPSTDARFFGGKSLTYYGRWVYKFEEAARRGAVACLIIHTDASAGYGWEVVRNSWGKEDPQVPARAGENALAFAGWLTASAAEKLFGRSVPELLQRADTRGFSPFALGKTLTLKIAAKIRPIETRNVVAMVEGSDPALKDQAVIYSAHWDHLGIDPALAGDQIYNGAVDNAVGCGMIIELARAWSALPQKPRRSAIFLAVTAEESGMRGSQYYAQSPAVPLRDTQLNLNFDAVPPYGRPKDLVAIGAERTTAWPLLQEAAQRFGFAISPDPRPEQGSYYRSDHFMFAKGGVPAFSLGLGMRYEGAGAEQSMAARQAYTKRYHQPGDEYSSDWDWAGVEAVAQLGFVLGVNAANHPGLLSWQPRDEFLRVRESSAKAK